MKVFAIPDSLIYKIKPTNQGLDAFLNGINLNLVFKDNNDHLWLGNFSDNYKFGLKDYDDAKWKNIDSDFETDEIDSTFKGIGWFRLHYRISKEYIGKAFMMDIKHHGASEIFNDGKLLSYFGRVSKDSKSEVCIDPANEYFALTVNDTLEHVLAIRYSNANFAVNEDKFDIDRVGFNLRFYEMADYLTVQLLEDYQKVFFIGIAMFLFALSLVHLMIFVFERSRKFNLYHSLFVLTLSMLFLLPIINGLVETPVIRFRMYYYSSILAPSFFILALALLYNLFQKKWNKFFYVALVFYAGSLVMKYVFNNFSGFFIIGLFFMMYFGSISISIKAIRKNFRGAKIVGFGVLGVTIFMILAIVALIIFEDLGVVLAIFLAILSILSLPLSMSVYLAYDFAGANKTLTQQIVQIEELSAQSLLAAEEKKHLLENQNQMLEEQVKVRTAEIVEQKEIIEEKNKDITDSINYAKRIQDVILTAKEVKYKLFPNAFVLFKPKDIVSGDFYWFTEKGGRKLIAACDCTGHGVPGALMSMVGNNVLNQIVNDRAITQPDQILNELDKQVRKTLKQDENADTKDGMDLALLSFPNENEMEYAGANRPLWIVRDNLLSEIKATKTSIGGRQYEQQAVFQGHKIPLSKGDTIYIFSDGYADQFNKEDKKLMTRRFKEILLSIQNLSMGEQEKYLDDFIEKWKGGLEQTDDILVIGIKI